MLGAANTPYARSVRPETMQPGSLPDPGLIFDSIFARAEYKEHPNKVSSILYYWASLIIHDLFQTNHRDMNQSLTSSYLDLSTLYGDTEEDQGWIRTWKDGKIKADCFMEERVLGCAFSVMTSLRILINALQDATRSRCDPHHVQPLP